MSRRVPKKLRISTPYGEFEMNADGRPDGGQSLLEKYRKQLEEHRSDGSSDAFGLDDEAVRALGEEALLYRIRREYFFQRDDHARARRDVLHGIDIIEFIRKYASDPEQQEFYWQFRADQEIFLRVSQAHLNISAKDYAGARREVEEAYGYIENFYGAAPSEEGQAALQERQEFLSQKFREIGEAWENDTGALANTAPALEEQLAEAVRVEDYERAARLRDQIRERNAQSR